jgi:polygalacturonase
LSSSNRIYHGLILAGVALSVELICYCGISVVGKNPKSIYSRNNSLFPQSNSVVDVRSMGAKGNGLTDDTEALQLALDRAASLPGSVVSFPPGVYLTSGVRLTNAKNITILGQFATLLKLPNSAPSFWTASASLLSLCACTDVRVSGLSFNGNRPRLSSAARMANTGIMILPIPAKDDGLIHKNNFAAVKPSQRITIDNCQFTDLGSYKSGEDKFGDGIYIFAASSVEVTRCRFSNVGRWAVAASDVIGLGVRYCDVNNTMIGNAAIALGSFDFEQEGADPNNGSYSRDILVDGCILYGRCAIYMNAIATRFNCGGPVYIRDITVRNCCIIMAYYRSWGESALTLNVLAHGERIPELTNVNISHNYIQRYGEKELTSAMRICAPNNRALPKDILTDENILNSIDQMCTRVPN